MSILNYWELDTSNSYGTEALIEITDDLNTPKIAEEELRQRKTPCNIERKIMIIIVIIGELKIWLLI